MVFLARRTQPLGICLSLFEMFRRLFLSLGRSHWSPCPLPLALYSLPSLALASPSTCRLGEGPEHRLKPPEITMLGGGLSGPCYPRRRPRGPTLSVSWCFYARPKSGLESPAFHPNPPTVHPPGLLPVPPCAGSCGVGRTGIGAASPFTHCPPRASPRGRVGPDVLVRCPYSSSRGFLLFSRWSPLVPKLLLGSSHPAFCNLPESCRSVPVG